MVSKQALGPAIREHIGREAWLSIGEAEWEQLRSRFAPVSENTLRKWIKSTCLPFGQPWRGVESASLDELERDLTEMAEAYRTWPLEARRTVIGAKDKARYAARNRKAATAKRELKNEMVEWMLVWLGDPAMFEDWVKLRKTYLAAQRSES